MRGGKTARRQDGKSGWGKVRLAALPACRLAVLCLTFAACKGTNGGPDRVSQVEEAADSADQMLLNMKTVITAGGVRQANLEADSAFVYENSGRADLKKIKVTFFTTTGVQTSVLIADAGIYHIRTGEMEAHGNVDVTRTSDGARLKTSVLRYNQSKNEVSTDQPYTFDEGQRHGAGTGFTSDPSFTNIHTQRLRGTGGGFSLPGQ